MATWDEANQGGTGVIAVAEKVRELVGKAPAGGIFHNFRIGDVAGLEVPGFGGAAGFTLTDDESGTVFRVGVVEEV
jgi:hypothetical protein